MKEEENREEESVSTFPAYVSPFAFHDYFSRRHREGLLGVTRILPSTPVSLSPSPSPSISLSLFYLPLVVTFPTNRPHPRDGENAYYYFCCDTLGSFRK